MGRASRRKAANRSQGVLDEARNIIERVGGPKEIVVRRDLPQEEKISHALCELLESEVVTGAPLEEYQAALRFIVIAWNVSLLDAEERSEALQDLATTMKCEGGAMEREILGHVERLIVRKQVLFPHDQRTIVTSDVWLQGNTVRVSAAALAAPPSPVARTQL